MLLRSHNLTLSCSVNVCFVSSALRLRIQRAVEHIAFRLFTVLLIILDLSLVVVDLSISNCVSANDALEIISHCIISFFVLEVALRLFAKGLVLFFSFFLFFSFLFFFFSPLPISLKLQGSVVKTLVSGSRSRES